MYFVVHEDGGILYFDEFLYKCMNWVLEHMLVGKCKYKYIPL